MAPICNDYKHQDRFESNAACHRQSLLLQHQVIVPFRERRLDLGPRQVVLFVELDGLREAASDTMRSVLGNIEGAAPWRLRVWLRCTPAPRHPQETTERPKPLRIEFVWGPPENSSGRSSRPRACLAASASTYFGG